MTVRYSNRCGSSAKNARRRLASTGSLTMSCPQTVMDPLLGAWMPAMHLRVEVFPAPFGPMRPTISPGPTVNDSASTARNSPYTFGEVGDGNHGSGRIVTATV